MNRLLEDSHEISSLIFSEIKNQNKTKQKTTKKKKKKKKKKTTHTHENNRLLQLRLTHKDQYGITIGLYNGLSLSQTLIIQTTK